LKSKVIVHRFRIGDVEDPEMMASFIIEEWFKEDKIGKWLNKIDPVVTANWQFDESGLCYNFQVFAYLEEKDYTYFCLLKE